MLNEQCKILCSLSSSPKQITVPCTSFCKADTSLCTCHQQDNLQGFFCTCGELSRQVISSTVLIEEGEEEAKHAMRVTT